jgi:hypothetical protein
VYSRIVSDFKCPKNCRRCGNWISKMSISDVSPYVLLQEHPDPARYENYATPSSMLFSAKT